MSDSRPTDEPAAEASGYDTAAEQPPGQGTDARLDYLAPEREYVRVDLAEGAEIDDRGPTAVTTTVRSGVNMRGWIILGLVVGVIAAFVLTYAFPEHPEFTRGQVLGFLLVFVTAFSGLLFAGIAALVDLVVSRRTRQITLTRDDQLR